MTGMIDVVRVPRMLAPSNCACRSLRNIFASSALPTAEKTDAVNASSQAGDA